MANIFRLFRALVKASRWHPGPCGLRCDGLSTALFVMGREKAAAHWAAHQDYEAVLVDESGTIWLTPGLKDRFIPVDQGETREIRIL